MEEFDIDSDDIMGTSIDALKESPKSTNLSDKSKFISDTEQKKIVYSNRDEFSDKNKNMQKLIFNLEKDLEVLASDEPIETPDVKNQSKLQYKINYNDLLQSKPVTVNNKIDNVSLKKNNHDISSKKSNHFLSDLDKWQVSTDHSPVDIDNEQFTNSIKLNTVKSNDYIGILIFVLLFMILNNKFIIETIGKISYMKNTTSEYPNLIIRSILFGIIIFYYKKYTV